MASTWAGHWSMSATSSPALVRSAATQLPFAPVPRTTIFFSILFPRQARVASLRLQVVLLDEPGHFFDVLMQEFGEFLRGIPHRHISKILKALSRLRHADGLRHRRL